MEMVIESLKAIQARDRLNDQEFANKLGYERNSSWNRIKNGKVPVSDKFLVRAHRAFPELGIFLPQNAINHSTVASADSPDKPRSQNLTSLWSRLRGFFIKQ